MSSWDSSVILATVFTLQDISSVTPQPDSTPILTLSKDAQSKGFYNTVCLPLTTQKWKDRWSHMCLQANSCERDVEAERVAEAWRAKPSFMLDEVTMTRLDEAEGMTVMISDWLELDSDDEWIRLDSEIALQQELAYASYLNVQNVILPPPRSRTHIASYARAVSASLKAVPYMQVSIQLPPYDPTIFHSRMPSHSRSSLIPTEPIKPPKLVIADNPQQPSDLDAMWELWDIVRSVCEYNVRLTLALDLSLPLPTVLGSLGKWTAEPVRYIFLPSSTFLSNNRGYPVLPKVTQTFLRTSMTHRPTIILSGASLNQHAKGGEAAYSEYVKHLEKTSPAVMAAKKLGSVENFAMGYQDYLQAPLQPLMDNLQSITYQTFEQDPVKYGNYEEAMYRAFLDWPSQDKIIVCIAGAGRGPLVARCLKALERSKREAMIYAVEKNPNAFVTLQGRQKQEWGSKVQLFFGDMRKVEIPEQADVLVSELLGSFGDNELSPECLDGAARFLKPTGISIPSSYTAHLAPLSSSKLYNEARASKDEKSMETPYVVMFQAVNILSDDGNTTHSGSSVKCGPQIQECWEFEHPRRGALLDERGLPMTNNHNTRSAKLRFHIPHAGVLHGLAGYFEAVLYGNVGLSIHPHRKDEISKDMLSWFPLFFPFQDPLYLPSNSELEVSIWRRTNDRQVWYEWHAESFLPIPNVARPSLEGADPSIIASPFSSSSRINSMLGSMSPSVGIGLGLSSPLIDAVDFPNPMDNRRLTRMSDTSSDAGSTSSVTLAEGYTLVKIGQSSLHNPGGRSSWIGL